MNLVQLLTPLHKFTFHDYIICTKTKDQYCSLGILCHWCPVNKCNVTPDPLQFTTDENRTTSTNHENEW